MISGNIIIIAWVKFGHPTKDTIDTLSVTMVTIMIGKGHNYTHIEFEKSVESDILWYCLGNQLIH